MIPETQITPRRRRKLESCHTPRVCEVTDVMQVAGRETILGSHQASMAIGTYSTALAARLHAGPCIDRPMSPPAAVPPRASPPKETARVILRKFTADCGS